MDIPKTESRSIIDKRIHSDEKLSRINIIYPKTYIDAMFKKAGVSIAREPKELYREIRNLLQSLSQNMPVADEEELSYGEWLHDFSKWLTQVRAIDKNMQSRVLSIISQGHFPEVPAVPPMNTASNKWLEDFKDWFSKLSSRKDNLRDRIKTFFINRPSSARLSKFGQYFQDVPAAEADINHKWLEESIVRVLRAAEVLANARVPAGARARPRKKQVVGILPTDLRGIVRGLEAVLRHPAD